MKILHNLESATEDEKDNLWYIVSISETENNLEELLIKEQLEIENIKLFIDKKGTILAHMTLKDRLKNRPLYEKFGFFFKYIY